MLFVLGLENVFAKMDGPEILAINAFRIGIVLTKVQVLVHYQMNVSAYQAIAIISCALLHNSLKTVEEIDYRPLGNVLLTPTRNLIVKLKNAMKKLYKIVIPLKFKFQ